MLGLTLLLTAAHTAGNENHAPCCSCLLKIGSHVSGRLSISVTYKKNAYSIRRSQRNIFVVNLKQEGVKGISLLSTYNMLHLLIPSIVHSKSKCSDHTAEVCRLD